MEKHSESELPPVGAGLTRRQFARRLAGATTGALGGGLFCATAAANASETQEPPLEPPKSPAPPEDPRIAHLEKLHGAPLTEAQRKSLPGQLKDIDGGGEALRKFALHDGGSEPGFVFHPVRGQNKATAANPRAGKKGAAHG